MVLAKVVALVRGMPDIGNPFGFDVVPVVTGIGLTHHDWISFSSVHVEFRVNQ